MHIPSHYELLNMFKRMPVPECSSIPHDAGWLPTHSLAVSLIFLFVASPAGESNAIATILRDLQQGTAFESGFLFLFVLPHVPWLL